MSAPGPSNAEILLDVGGLQKSFGDNHVLQDVSFTTRAGTVTAVLGPSGSGKTTLLRSLNALDLPDAGTITIGAERLDFGAGAPGPAQLARYRAQSGMVFQSHNLFPHKTVLENMTEGPVVVQKQPRAEAVDDAESLLALVGLVDKRDAYPHQLSGGQQQRVAIARALAMHPKVVLFDEPTSALDPELVGEVLTVIKNLAGRGTTMVIGTHQIRFAEQVADQVLFVDGGQIVEAGPPAQVIGAPSHERTRQFLGQILDPG